MIRLECEIILVATRDKQVKKVALDVLKSPHTRLLFAQNIKDYFEYLLHENVSLIIFDANILPLKGFDAYSVSKNYHPDITSVLIYDHENFEDMGAILKKGFVYRTAKPLEEKYLKEIHVTTLPRLKKS